MKCAVSEVFGPTIQGEGLYTGEPCVFVRFNGCNLACAFGNSICDTAYTSHYKSPNEFEDTDSAALKVSRLLGSNVKYVVFTGGEPMLQQQAQIEIINKLREIHTGDLEFMVETNASIAPKQELLDNVLIWSLSPKLPSSAQFDGTGLSETLRERHHRNRFNKEAIWEYLISGNCQLKFVWSEEASTEEIHDWLTSISEGANEWFSERGQDFNNILHNTPILLMPAGSTREELMQTQEGCVKSCIENKWRFCDRLHIRIWDNMKRV